MTLVIPVLYHGVATSPSRTHHAPGSFGYYPVMKHMPPGTFGSLLGFEIFCLVRFIADKQTGSEREVYV